MRWVKYILALLFLVSLKVQAAHTKGGWMYYEYLGTNTSTNTASYRITLKLYTECILNPGQIDATAPITIFNNVAPYTQFSNTNVAYTNDEIVRNCVAQSGVSCYPCISSAPAICFRIFTYTQTVNLPINANGYVVSYQRCCRVAGINNISAPSNSYGGTWSVVIPGTTPIATAYQNSSAKFNNNDTAIICKGAPFTFDFSATDSDGDQLSYSFSNALAGGSQSNPVPNPSGNPNTFTPVDYAPTYSGLQPLGPGVTINPATGVVSGIAPTQTGVYVISVTVTETRNGQAIASIRKELHINIADCSTIKPEVEPDAITCNGYSFQFINYNTSPLINSYFWDFGVPNVTNDTSNLPNPTFTYPDTGVYIVKVYVNRGQQCSDSATVIRRVFPGFFPNFTNVGVCYTSPIQFNDLSTTQYGVINSWRWDFGDAAVLSDTSRLQNPTYQYSIPGIKTVQLIVTNSKGCIDTITKNISIIDKPTITLPFRDTLICSIDTLTLQSSFSSGSASWLPNYRIINANTNTPQVYPLVTTTYYVTANDQGCIQQDSIKVNVKDYVTVDVMPDTTICLTDSVVLQTNSDALSYLWTPAQTLNNPTIQDPVAKPTAAVTKYYVTANIGKCQSSDSVTVYAFPYPQVSVTGDTTICYGDFAQLFGTATGQSFSWSPLTGIVNPSQLNPIVRPLSTTQYVLSTQGAPGCNKPAFDTVVVTVRPQIIAFAGNDTTIVANQPLQLNASGGPNYLWSPATFLNNPTIANPIAVLTINQDFAVRVSDALGCYDYDTIRVTVFKTAPEIFVPTVFTPNGDGVNDKLTPVAVGLTKFDFFEVYNRWGNRIFRTTKLKDGWDGTYRGVPQGIDTYVWQVQGTDYTGKRIFRKGTAVLVR